MTQVDSSPAAPPMFIRRLVCSPFGQTVLGALLLWLALPGTTRQLGAPGLSLAWLAWFAPVLWVGLALRPDAFTRRQYLQVWLGGWCYWMLTLYWVCLPHPFTPIGWPLLCIYLGMYVALFVGLTRLAIRRTPAPVWIVAPAVWVALEFAQAHLFTGLQIGALSHTQAYVLSMIQVSDLGGGYAVSFVLMMAAATIAFAVRTRFCIFERGAAVLTSLLVILATLYYGQHQLAEPVNREGPVVALLQSATKATWDPDPNRSQQIMDANTQLMSQVGDVARLKNLRIDLIVWPESMFRVPVLTLDGKIIPPAQMPEGYTAATAAAGDWLRGLANQHNTALLLGADRFDLSANPQAETGYDEKNYNSALLTDRTGKITDIYDKTHRVPFGEYIPFAKNMPGIYYLTPMSGGLGEGEGPVAMRLDTSAGQVILSPSICYESVLPHVIRRQVATLTEQGTRPDVLVNVTNDAWFWGSSELDLHLVCAIFRAVENRRPLAVAANTGLSAIVDGAGRVLEVSTRMQEDVIVRQVPLDGRESFYSQHGDWFALACLLVTVVLTLAAVSRRAAPMAEATCSVAGPTSASES